MGWIILLIAIVLFFYLSFKYGLNRIENNIPTKEITIDLTPFTHYEEFPVAGVFEEDTKAYIVRFLKKKYPISLIPEPNNEYSDSAIGICDNKFKIGYVPEEYTEEVLEIIKGNHKALISAIYYDGDWIDIYVKLYFKE